MLRPNNKSLVAAHTCLQLSPTTGCCVRSQFLQGCKWTQLGILKKGSVSRYETFIITASTGNIFGTWHFS